VRLGHPLTLHRRDFAWSKIEASISSISGQIWSSQSTNTVCRKSHFAREKDFVII
jgi:hypothetical protein